VRVFDHGSKNRLTEKDLRRFPGETLFDRLARAVCRAHCLPRKELFEAWETARRTRRLIRGRRVVDVAGGHGLLAHLLLLLDSTSPSAVVVDPAPPASSQALHAALADSWPRLRDRVNYVAMSVEAFQVSGDDLVVSSHACGKLTDRVLDAAITAKAPLAVLPCCHDFETCDRGALAGWMDGALAIDAVRAMRLRAAGYRVVTQTIPSEITEKNRLLIGLPASAPAAAGS
jgi:hypothetical protein